MSRAFSPYGFKGMTTRRVHGIAIPIVLVLLVGCGGNGSSAVATPSISVGALQGMILFTRAGGAFGDETVFTADVAGTHELRITGFGVTCCPRWSPDGTSILITESAPDGNRITTGIINPDGSLVRKIILPDDTLNLGCTQAWSTRTGRLACEGWDDTIPGRNGIYTIRASDGGDLVRVTSSPGDLHDIPGDFSLDGSRIFFIRPPNIPNAQSLLYVVNADGSGLRAITPGTRLADIVGNAGERLSRDGRRLVFTSMGSIWMIHPDGSGLAEVFQDTQGRLAITPTWSPDGRFILFGLDPAGSVPMVQTAPVNGLYVIRADGTGLTPLITSPDWKREPDWLAAS